MTLYCGTHNWLCEQKMLNHGLNHGLFLSLFKLIPCPIHWIVCVLAYLNFRAVLVLPKTAGSAQTYKSMSSFELFGCISLLGGCILQYGMQKGVNFFHVGYFLINYSIQKYRLLKIKACFQSSFQFFVSNDNLEFFRSSNFGIKSLSADFF